MKFGRKVVDLTLRAFATVSAPAIIKSLVTPPISFDLREFSAPISRDRKSTLLGRVLVRRVDRKWADRRTNLFGVQLHHSLPVYQYGLPNYRRRGS